MFINLLNIDTIIGGDDWYLNEVFGRSSREAKGVENGGGHGWDCDIQHLFCLSIKM